MCLFDISRLLDHSFLGLPTQSELLGREAWSVQGLHGQLDSPQAAPPLLPPCRLSFHASISRLGLASAISVDVFDASLFRHRVVHEVCRRDFEGAVQSQARTHFHLLLFWQIWKLDSIGTQPPWEFLRKVLICISGICGMEFKRRGSEERKNLGQVHQGVLGKDDRRLFLGFFLCCLGRDGWHLPRQTHWPDCSIFHFELASLV
mmetsp:Transcript_81067/g.169279  ORF Transcript_81067/g.169279 Transcript_81067/m.169279 type:complete len:204 (+) Transcript_81067:971-1582(+)